MQLTAAADAWIEADSTSNMGDDSTLKVRSKSDGAARAALRFALPAPPPGCVVGAAELRLYSASPKPGRTLDVQRAGASWSETSLNWPNQPSRVGPIVSTQSGSDPGWRTWPVGSLVRDMYASGAHGFIVSDRVETDDSEQSFNSRETSTERPTLVITFAGA